jgi:hypothetical protein
VADDDVGHGVLLTRAAHDVRDEFAAVDGGRSGQRIPAGRSRR